jgi:hypothetical protein
VRGSSQGKAPGATIARDQPPMKQAFWRRALVVKPQRLNKKLFATRHGGHYLGVSLVGSVSGSDLAS